MADTTFISGTTIPSAWLNDVNDNIYSGNANIAGTLKYDLASKTVAASGAGLVGLDTQNTPPIGTVAARLGGEVSITDAWIGAVADGALTASSGGPRSAGANTGTNNYTVIQNALNAIVAAGIPTRVIIPKGIFRVDNANGLKIDAAFITLDFRGGILDMSGCTSYGMRICSTAASVFTNSPWCIGHGAIFGPIAASFPSSVGLSYSSNVGGYGTTDLQGTSCYGLNVFNFGTSIVAGENAYLNSHWNCQFQFSNLFFSMPLNTNGGVTWPFFFCRFLNGVHGFDVREDTANIALYECGLVTTGGVAMRVEYGYINWIGGSIEVDASTGAQLIYNNNIGSYAVINMSGVNVLMKNQITQSTVEINSLNTNLTVTGGHWAVADAAAPGTVPLIKGTGSGTVVFSNVVFDGALNALTSNSLGAGFVTNYTPNAYGGANIYGVGVTVNSGVSELLGPLTLHSVTANYGAAPTLTISSNTIAPTKGLSKVGAGLIKTITAPSAIATAGGTISIIPTAAFTWDTTANIAIAGTAVISRKLDFSYDSGTSKWYPSYV